MKKLNRTDHQESIGEIASYSQIHSRAFVLPSFLKSEWRKRFWEEEKKQSGTEAYERECKDEKLKRSRWETIARPCVKNEDIQMEIWFYINHQARAVLPDHFSVSPCSLSLPFFPFSSSDPRVCISPRAVFFLRSHICDSTHDSLGAFSVALSRGAWPALAPVAKGFICFISPIPINIYRLFAWPTISRR